MLTPEDLIEDTKLAKYTDTDLASLSAMVHDLQKVEIEMLNIQSRQAELAEEKRKISQEKIPNFMNSLGFSELKLKDGSSVEVKPVIKCSIPKEQKEKTLEWMRENNSGDLIKNELILELGKGDDEIAAQIIKEVAEKFGKMMNREENVHWQTLNAWAKEQIANGVQLPSDLFSLFMFSEAKIKAPKK